MEKKWVKNKIRIYEMTDLIDDTFEPDYGEETEGQGDKTPKVKSDEDEGEIQSDCKSDDGEIKSGLFLVKVVLMENTDL